MLALSTFEDHCLEGKLTFGDPLLDSGVVGVVSDVEYPAKQEKNLY